MTLSIMAHGLATFRITTLSIVKFRRTVASIMILGIFSLSLSMMTQ